ncbi:MAG: hypothetical protein EPN46_02720 [Candidimonas sp.]|nr:MAG: hypothetical protein EPN77_11190 [Candidimonas sp.]TAM24746.1 MAG: hypothetical protein EPN62_05840 [Candidimonas sp.]TAM79998.1 MAG: hypothetical protein EPN46_02720 [Candidimonas sp.]
MNPSSQIIGTLEQGVVLDVAMEELQFKAYVVISEPDVNRVADFVPREQFETSGDLHVAAVSDAHDAREQVEEITFNMNLNDGAVFLCQDQAAYAATLEELGQHGLLN